MQRVDIERKRPTLLPWLVGLAVLALIVWGVTTLLAAPQTEEQQIAAPTAEDTLPPAAIPAPPQPVTAMAPRMMANLAALGEEHVGQVIRADGEVVATGTNGFWILAASTVLRVESERPVRKGESVTVDGTVEPAEAERTDRIMSEVLSRHPDVESWDVVRSVMLVERNGGERTGD